MPKTKRGALRQYNAVMNRVFRSLRGGLEYGLDWPTFYATFPDEAAHVTAIKAVYKSLPD
jgi:hypothetical protein